MLFPSPSCPSVCTERLKHTCDNALTNGDVSALTGTSAGTGLLRGSHSPKPRPPEAQKRKERGYPDPLPVQARCPPPHCSTHASTQRGSRAGDSVRAEAPAPPAPSARSAAATPSHARLPTARGVHVRPSPGPGARLQPKQRLKGHLLHLPEAAPAAAGCTDTAGKGLPPPQESRPGVGSCHPGSAPAACVLAPAGLSGATRLHPAGSSPASAPCLGEGPGQPFCCRFLFCCALSAPSNPDVKNQRWELGEGRTGASVRNH